MENFKSPKLWDGGGNLNVQWYLYYSYKHPDTKEYYRIKRYISNRLKTKADRYASFQAIKADLVAKLRRGWSPFEDKPISNIIESLETILKIRANKTLRRKTIHTDGYVVRHFIQFLVKYKLDKKQPQDILPIHAQRFSDWLMVDCQLGPCTINNHIVRVKLMFNEMIRREMLTINPFAHAEKLQVSEGDVIAFTEDQMKLIRETLPNHDKRLWLAAQLIFYCFIRPVELTRLKRSNIDLQRKQIVMHGGMSKNKKQQTIIIPDPLASELAKYDWSFPNDNYIFSSNLDPGDRYVFPTRLQEKWREYAKYIGLPGTHIYWLKHTGNGLALDAGVDIRDIQMQNRHHSLDQTMQYLRRFRKIPSEKLMHTFPKL